MPPVATASRPHRFNMLLSDDELSMVQALAQLQGLTASDLFRTQLREAFARYARANGLTVPQGLALVRQRRFPNSMQRLEAADALDGAPTRDELRVLSLLANKTTPLQNTDILQYVAPLDGAAVSRITASLAKRFLIEGDVRGWTIAPEGRAELQAWRARR